ncbi:MAG: hypothetical protein RL385_3392, partial [Pseudomonadota bacterium]
EVGGQGGREGEAKHDGRTTAQRRAGTQRSHCNRQASPRPTRLHDTQRETGSDSEKKQPPTVEALAHQQVAQVPEKVRYAENQWSNREREGGCPNRKRRRRHHGQP